jgi:hypothetical protein
MNLLFALLAFAGLMAFLSTVASVFVEAIHKLLALRRAGLEEMLRAIHARVLNQLDPLTAQQGGADHPSASAESKAFARQITENITLIGGGSFSAVRNIPIISALFRRRFERLSTLQFIEQLAQTPIGQSLADLPRGARAQALKVAAYQYERFGEQQSAYFQSRARVVSVLVAIVFAFALNVDAVNIFDRLYRDIGVRDSVMSLVSPTPPEAAAATGPTPENTQGDLARQAAEQGARETVAELKSLGIPIGFAAYPYCVGAAAANDSRCGGESLEAFNVAATGERLATGNWVLWLISVLAAGGMIGLGAPFWYDLFRRVARLVPAARVAQSFIGANQTQTSGATPTLAVRNSSASHPEALLTAFDVSSGKAAQVIAGAHQAIHASTPASQLPGAAAASSIAAPPPRLTRQYR